MHPKMSGPEDDGATFFFFLGFPFAAF